MITIQENNATAQYVRESVRGCDMLFWVHTHGWDIPGMSEILADLKRVGVPTVGYHLDLWIGIERQKDLDTDEYWNIEYFFSVDPQMVDLLNSRGVKAHFLPAGVLSRECYIGQPREEFKRDIIFVGSKDYHPEWQYRPQLIDWLQSTYGDRFKLHGREAGKHYDQIRGKDLNDLYASARIVVGDTLCPGFNYPEYLSDRIFETTGRGGFIIHPYIKGIENHFHVGSEVICYDFNDFDQLKYLIDSFLENDKEREEIRMAGHERTKNHHTYSNRLANLLQVVFA